MVGLSSARLGYGDPCWILIDKGQREGVYNVGDFFATRRYELFQGEYLGQVEADHPVWRKVTELPYDNVKAVRARLIDRSLANKGIGALPFWGEPRCNYAVISYQYGLEFRRKYTTR